MDEFKLRKIRLGSCACAYLCCRDDLPEYITRHALDVADEQLERKRDKVSEGLEAPDSEPWTCWCIVFGVV